VSSVELPLRRGFGTKVSPLVRDLLNDEPNELPAALVATSNHWPSPQPVPFRRYYERQFADLERERVWKKVWQLACREEDIPEVGDRVAYEVGTLSFMVVRSGPDSFRAFHNACRHRGTRLCDGFASGSTVRCPFHGWEWDLDGALKQIPSRWDFPDVEDASFGLAEVALGRWGGYVLINPDPDASPFEPSLGVLPEHFDACPVEDLYTVFHIRKRLNANWKLSMEAFLESYHVLETHTEFLGFTGDANTQYDVFEDGASHVNRLITPSGIPSPHLGETASIDEAAEMTFAAFAMVMPGVEPPKYDRSLGTSARAQIAQWRRQLLGAALGRDFSSWTDCAMIDSVQYWMFPNFCPWWGLGLPLVYQFLPLGDDPERSIMDVRVMGPVPGGGAPRPPAAPTVHLGFDDPFTSIGEIGFLGTVFDQDAGNLARLQAGVRAAAEGADVATLGRYQECRVQHFHEVLDRYLGLS
jgi:phenylpropionate dioxygenase-like ring-hydroxylating dioxygenase large terminal subunit